MQKKVKKPFLHLTYYISEILSETGFLPGPRGPSGAEAPLFLFGKRRGAYERSCLYFAELTQIIAAGFFGKDPEDFIVRKIQFSEIIKENLPQLIHVV